MAPRRIRGQKTGDPGAAGLPAIGVIAWFSPPRTPAPQRKLGQGTQRRGKAGAGNDGPGAPASPSANAIATPSGRSPGSQAGRDPGAAPSRAVAQWRSAAPLLAYRCGGSAGIDGIDPRSAPASRFIPSDEGPPAHLKRAEDRRFNAGLQWRMLGRTGWALPASPARRLSRGAVTGRRAVGPSVRAQQYHGSLSRPRRAVGHHGVGRPV
jgi:hypothetical protein